MERDRTSIIHFFLRGKSPGEIMKALEIPQKRRKFVYRTIKRYKDTGSVVAGNERFMNGLSKRNSVHLRMTHVQFVHVHFLTPTPLRSFSSFISFSSFRSFRPFRSVHFVQFVYLFKTLRWYDCGSIKVAFLYQFLFFK